jgi:endogenous inhibitor of DNA gyrase (YacG/DUF329 family)
VALVACAECGKAVSTDARVCPHCGKRRRRGVLSSARLAVPLLVLAPPLVLGFFHVVQTGAGVRLCPKETWSVQDTFISRSEFVGKPMIALLDRARVVRALVACQLIEADR